MNQPPLWIWVNYAYDSLHLHSCTHVHNMTLTDTIDTNCHRSYSLYCSEYLFDTATSKQRVYMHKLNSNRAHLHQITKSTKPWISHIPVNVQSTCTQFAINLLFVTQFYLQSTCTQFAIYLLTCNSTLLAIYLHYNSKSTCSFVPQFYLQSTCTVFAINLLICNSILLAINLHTICNQLALYNSILLAIYDLQKNLLLANQLQLAFQLLSIYNQFAPSTTTSNGIQIACNLQFVALCLQFQLTFELLTIYNQTCFQPNYFNWHIHCPHLNLLLCAYNFNRHTNCLQFAIRCSLPTTLTGTQIACNLRSTCSLQHYNFNWHSNCLQFAICCSLPTTLIGTQIACNL